jgi:glycine cleavage system H lipoate-binding protein
MAKQVTKTRKSKVPQVFDMGAQQCLWSAAGVAEPRLCHNAFDCLSCSFDKVMQRKKSLGWQTPGLEQPAPGIGLWNKQRWLETPREERWCRHMLSGRIAARTCAHLYECRNCEFDQILADESPPNAGENLPLVLAAGFEVPPSYYFHPGHTWARLEYGGCLRVGLDDLASKVFGPADEFHLPRLGEAVRCGGGELAFSRGNHQARASCPVEGVVVASNPKAFRQAPAMCRSPYLDGWLVLIKPVQLQRDLSRLRTGDDSVAWMVEESQRLSDILTADSGQRLAATGGRVVNDVFGTVPGLDWDHLVGEFLRP